MRRAFLYMFLGLLTTLLVSAAAADTGKKCYCRTATGQKLELGQVTCLKTNKGMREARCDMVLNNTAWIFTGNPCPVAEGNGESGDDFARTRLRQSRPFLLPQLPDLPKFYNVRLAGAPQTLPPER